MNCTLMDMTMQVSPEGDNTAIPNSRRRMQLQSTTGIKRQFHTKNSNQGPHASILSLYPHPIMDQLCPAVSSALSDPPQAP